MARIRFIEKKADIIEVDTFKDITTASNISNIPALITVDHSNGRTVVDLSYTGSTESVITTPIQSGIDVSTGIHSGRIVKVNSAEGIDITEALNKKNIGTTSRAHKNYELSKTILTEIWVENNHG